MAQQYLMFNDYTAPMVDEDGYQVAEAVTSASNRGRTMRGDMKGGVLFTVEAYNLKWTNISAKDVAEIKKRILGRQQFDFYHFNSYTAQWETKPFIANNISSSYYSLVDGHEMADELSFQVTSVEPLDTED
jgi:hypothetical protein|nr:MAG TPA: hypothetical protein [Caudoviricetes sp.]